jgi:hypothetical protein
VSFHTVLHEAPGREGEQRQRFEQAGAVIDLLA